MSVNGSLTFRITAVAAEVAAGGVFELAFAFGAFADEASHRRLRLEIDRARRHFADLAARFGKIFQTPVG